MRLFRKGPLLLLSCALLLTTAAYAGKGSKDAAPADAGKKDKAGKSGDAKADAAVADASDATGKMVIPLVEGHDSIGLKIPYFVNGRRQMNYDIGVASKLDADNVKMSDLQVQTFDDAGAPEMKIEMPQSVMNMSTHVIKSDTKTVITRPDMRITGNTMEFNTLTKQGQLQGQVHMTIYNIKSLAAPDDADKDKPGAKAPAPAAAPAATPAPAK